MDFYYDAPEPPMPAHLECEMCGIRFEGEKTTVYLGKAKNGGYKAVAFPALCSDRCEYLYKVSMNIVADCLEEDEWMSPDVDDWDEWVPPAS